jgi:hypothetical protein
VDHRPEDPDNLFRIAIALEQRAAAFFRLRANSAAPGSAEQLLYLELGAEERDHADLLTTEYERWRARKPGLLTGDPLVEAARSAHSAARPRGRSTRRPCCWPTQMRPPPRWCAATRNSRMRSCASAWRGRRRPGRRAACGRRPRRDQAARRHRLGGGLPRHHLGGRRGGGRQPADSGGRMELHPGRGGFQHHPGEHAEDTPPPWRSRVVLLEPGRAEVAAAAPVPPHSVDDDTPAFWCHSSGTSGKPKAVVHRHGFAREIERVSRERLGIVASDRLFATSRLFFSYPQTNTLFAGLRIGATVILDPQWPTAASAAATVGRQRPTVFFSVPSLYRNLLHAGLAPGLVRRGAQVRLRRRGAAGRACAMRGGRPPASPWSTATAPPRRWCWC